MAGIRSLSEWPTSEPIDDLLQVAKTSDEKTMQILGLRGYIRLIDLDTEHSEDVKAQMYKNAFSLSSEVGEKRMVLSGLAKVKSKAALEQAAKALNQTELRQEAEVAIVRISQNIWREYPEETRIVLEAVLRSENQEIREQARQLLADINK